MIPAIMSSTRGTVDTRSDIPRLSVTSFRSSSLSVSGYLRPFWPKLVTEDVAALMEEGQAGTTYVSSGPEALSYGNAAEAIGTAIGKKVAYQAAEPRAFRDDLVAEREGGR